MENRGGLGLLRIVLAIAALAAVTAGTMVLFVPLARESCFGEESQTDGALEAEGRRALEGLTEILTRSVRAEVGGVTYPRVVDGGATLEFLLFDDLCGSRHGMPSGRTIPSGPALRNGPALASTRALPDNRALGRATDTPSPGPRVPDPRTPDPGLEKPEVGAPGVTGPRAEVAEPGSNQRDRGPGVDRLRPRICCARTDAEGHLAIYEGLSELHCFGRFLTALSFRTVGKGSALRSEEIAISFEVRRPLKPGLNLTYRIKGAVQIPTVK